MKKVFVIMPFKDDFFEVYEYIKQTFSESYEFSNAGEEANQQNILKDIIQPIYESDIILADLTGLNPNVMYELGIAHTFNKKTIIITQDPLSSLPFDLKQYRATDYNTHFKRFNELLEFLEKSLKGAVDNTIVFSNPVNDFVDLNGTRDIAFFEHNNEDDIIELGEKGFIDFVADIESDANNLTNNFNEIALDVQNMNDGVSECTGEINRVSNNGGNTSISFIRKETRKAAKHIESFSKKLRAHNSSMMLSWDKIEKNTLGLLDNPITNKGENREEIIAYLKALVELKESALNSSENLDEVKLTMLTIVGIERSLNQAVKFVNEDLTNYGLFTEKLSLSVDKILLKARKVLGDDVFEE